MGLLIFLLLNSALGLHFYIKEGDKKCFVSDIPQENVILGTYALHSEVLPDSVKLTVEDPKGTKIYESFVKGEGKFSYTSQTRGQHRTCVESKAGSWFDSSKIKFELSIDNTHEEVEHTNLASKEKVTHLEDIVIGINERLEEVVKQQDYSREKEAEFKDESEQINSNIFYFTLFQTAVLAAAGIWQIFNLKNFFEARKVI